MTEDGRIEAPAGAAAAPAAYRGFLFADVRGFTAFAERHGNAAAAAMVGRFLEIARTAITRHGGSEMATEGDAIHAVFQSASSAVLCGLDIVDGAAELNAREPDRPLGLGVGIHAGEAVETAEGYIGRAVNIAARLCALARAGEVLVSSTVKGITQASIQVGFIPRGQRRLKGIRDPILVYAVSRDMTARAPREVPRGVMVGAAGVAGVILVVLATIGGLRLLSSLGAGPAASAAPSPSAAGPSAQPVVMGPLPIGTYASRQFQPPFTFTVADTGWTANRDVAGLFGLIREGAPRGGLVFARVQEVVTTPCGVGDENATAPASSQDVIPQLQALGHLTVSDVKPATVSGAAGQQADITVADASLAACGGLAGADVPIFRAGGEIWGATPGERFRVVAVRVADQPITMVLSLDWTETHSVQELEELLQLGQRVVDSVEF